MSVPASQMRRDSRIDPMAGQELPEPTTLSRGERVAAEQRQQQEMQDAGITVLTENDIAQSYNLQKLNALPGDKIQDNQLLREVSVEPRGEVLASQDIQNSPTLKELGAELGDEIVDGKLVKSGRNDPLKNFLFSFGQAETDVGNWGDYLESIVPLGRITFSLDEGLKYFSPEEFYGEDVDNLSPEDVRNRIEEFKAIETENLLETFTPIQDGYGLAGTFAGSVASPTIALPAGAGYRGAIALGGLYGAQYEVANQLAETGTITDVPELAKTTALGAASGPAGVAILRSGKYVAEAVRNKSLRKTASRVQDEFEETVNTEVALGTPLNEAIDVAKTRLNVDNEVLSRAAKLTNKKPKLLSTQDKARQALINDITSDSAATKSKVSGLGKTLGALNSTLDSISRPLGGRLRRFDSELAVQTGNNIVRVRPFQTAINNLPRRLAPNLKRHLLNGEFDLARDTFRSVSPELEKAFDESLKVVKELGENLKASGYDFDLTENYFPRVVKDLKGLRESLGVEENGFLEKALRSAASSKNMKVADLSIEEKSDIINKVIRGYVPKVEGGKLSFTKPRKIKEISDEQLQYYANPAESLDMYIRRAVNDIEKRKFFGKSAQLTDEGLFDANASIGSVIEREIAQGTLNPDQQEAVEYLLSSRFIGGETPDQKWSRTIKDVGYASTIGNPFSALVNLDELARSGAFFGMRNTLASLFGKKEMKVIDLGINQINQEFAEPEKAARYLTQIFKFSGFRALDELGKNATINASIRDLRQKALTTAGRRDLRRKYKDMFPDEIETVIDDLASGTINDQTKALAFTQLESLQPVSMSSMPPAYLNNPGTGRLMYMLKSFTIKNYDTIRNQIVREFNEGSKVTASKKAAALLAWTSISGIGIGTVQDLMLGREVKPEDIPDKALWHLMSIAGLNRYLANRYIANGDITDAAVQTLRPATPLIDDALKLAYQTPEIIQGEREAKPFERMSGVPIVGRFLYNWFGGGAERYNEQLD